jgi:hypothetical protein
VPRAGTVSGRVGRVEAGCDCRSRPTACASAVEAREDRRRVKGLERQLHRKDKALAEAAALLVLSALSGLPRRRGRMTAWKTARS